MARRFKGQDRRTLNKAKKCLQLLVDRDTIARNPAKTAKISTRTEVFPVADTSLNAALTAVQDQIQDKLDQTA